MDTQVRICKQTTKNQSITNTCDQSNKNIKGMTERHDIK